MQEPIKYAIFRTKWGFFGLAGGMEGLLRSRLPAPTAEEIRAWLVKKLPGAQGDPAFFAALQEQIKAYFEGKTIHFAPRIRLNLHGFTAFQRAVLTACRGIRPGCTITYAQLARRIGQPRAARAVANALAANPLPLIIPCHRVVRSDGTVGGFSAPGGERLKKRLLQHERPENCVLPADR